MSNLANNYFLKSFLSYTNICMDRCKHIEMYVYNTHKKIYIKTITNLSSQSIVMFEFSLTCTFFSLIYLHTHTSIHNITYTTRPTYTWKKFTQGSFHSDLKKATERKRQYYYKISCNPASFFTCVCNMLNFCKVLFIVWWVIQEREKWLLAA